MSVLREVQALRAISLLIAVCLVGPPVQAKYGGGSGTGDDPYQIWTAEQMNAVGANPGDWNEHFKLMADIDLAGFDGKKGRPVFKVIAPDTDAVTSGFQGTFFTGVFDGNGHTISRLILAGGSYLGLFGALGRGAEVRDLGVEDVSITGSGGSIGGLAGYNESGSVRHCYSAGLVSGSYSIGGLVGDNKGSILNSYSTGEVSVSTEDTDSKNIGGLVGSNYYEATLCHCYSTCEIKGLDRKSENFGGLVGLNQGGVLHCYSTGSVSGSNDGDKNFGGLVGDNEGSVINCYSAGSVISNRNVGGMAGYNGGRASNCYSTGSVTGNQYVGGFVGYNQESVTHSYSIGKVIGKSGLGGFAGYSGSNTAVSNCFWDVDSSELGTSAGGTGLVTSKMMDKSTYTAARWDFAGEKEDGLHEIWQMPPSGGYPELSVFAGYTPAQLSGNGTAEDPYLIGDANELGAVLYYEPKANYHLICDIDLSGINWSGAVITELDGVFNGNGFVIRNLTISGFPRIGLFGTIYPGAEVKNLGIEDANVAGSVCVGALTGQNCGKVKACYASGKISGNNSVGGLVGQNYGGTVINCYSTGAVTGNGRVGGLVGGTYRGDIRTCYAAGKVTGSTDAGGLVGYKDKDSGIVIASFWDTERSGWVTSAAGVGGKTKPMQMAGTFLEAGWDFVGEPENGLHEVWQMPAAGGYPVLALFHGYEPPQLTGKGTIEEPYLISSASELGAIVYYDPGAAYLLTDDIDLTGTTWSTDVVIPEFSGVLDGNDHTISNLLVVIPDSNYVGLFGQLEAGAQVKNLGVVDAVMDGFSRVGILAGSNQGKVANCRTGGDVTGTNRVGGLLGDNSRGDVSDSCSAGKVSGEDFVGGLVGVNSGSVTDSNSTCEVNGSDYVGGLVGHNSSGTIGACRAEGSVTAYADGKGSDQYVGGLVGQNIAATVTKSCAAGRVLAVDHDYVGGFVGDNTGEVTSCYSIGDVNGVNYVGGFVGDNDYGRVANSYSRGRVYGQYGVGGFVGDNNSDGSTIDCYSTGMVNGSEDVGGFAGNNHWCDDNWIPPKCYHGTISGCFWDTDASGFDASAGGTGKTTAEMKDINAYQSANWDFRNVWRMRSSYPELRWQELPREAVDDANDLVRLVSNPEDKYYMLSADIDLSGVSLKPAGRFTGVFDGKGYALSNLRIDTPNSDEVGMFGTLASGAQVKDLRLKDVYVRGRNRVGALVGYGRCINEISSTITGCSIEGVVLGTGDSVGGIVGYNEGTVNDCNSAGEISGGRSVGGLVGSNGGTVNRSKSAGKVNGNDSVGGLVGRNIKDVYNCYSHGPVQGSSNVGGLVGANDANDARMAYSYSIGTVDGDRNVGGLVGYSYGASRVSQSFWDSETSGQGTSAGGTSRTTAQMQTASTFLDAGWDFAAETRNGTRDIWWIVEGKIYPRLWWEYGAAFSPDPVDGATEVARSPTLMWVPGAPSLQHDVYFGDNPEAVAHATTDSSGIYIARQAPEVNTYEPGNLDLDKSYYWRIDEVDPVDPDSLWTGGVWSFTTVDFIPIPGPAVDDFESYTGKVPNLLSLTWAGGQTNGTGASVGAFAERTIVHGGLQSMSMSYDNVSEPWYSEAERAWGTPQDWTINSADTLTLYFRGEANNGRDRLYVGVEDGSGRIGVIPHPDAEAVLATEWQKWHLSLPDLRAAGVDVTAVRKMIVGVGDRDHPKRGAAGRIYIDDIRLTTRAP